MKTNTVYETVEVCAVPEKDNVLSDQIVSLPSLDKDGEAPILFRRIEYWNADKQEVLVFFTNLLHLAASTVAAIYKERWQVELFFKALKQNLKVKSFLGTSANAVKTQIWTALIAMLILKYLQMKSSWMVAFQSCGPAASATVHLHGLMGMAQQSNGRTASSEETGRAVTHAADVVVISWTAEVMQASA
jgi:hypothetical protein